MSDTVPLTEAERERIEEVDRLVLAGEDSVPTLVGMLSDPSWVVRRAVVGALAALGEKAVDALVDTLQHHRDDEGRISASVDALVASAAPVERQVVAGLAYHPNPAVVVDAAMILGRRRNPTSVKVLIELLRHQDDNVAVAATEALSRVGGRAAVDSLIDAVQSGSFFRVFPAIDVLGRSGDPRAVPVLAQLLENPMYALEAARALGRSGERAAVAPLVNVAAQASESLVRVAALALAELHARYGARFGEVMPIEAAVREAGKSGAAVRRLVASLSGAEPQEQMAISLLLGIMGGREAAPALSRLLDSDQGTARAAAQALKKLGQDADDRTLQTVLRGDSDKRRALLPVLSHQNATVAVISCLSDPDPVVRTLACEALARIGNTDATRPLFALLADPHPGVVQAAVAAIQSLGSTRTEKLALEAARSPTSNIRRAALRILSYFGYPSALETFVEALQDSDTRLRETAIQGLPFIDDRRALETLFQLTKDPDNRNRAAAVRALGFAGDDLRVKAYLLRALEDPEAWVRYYASQALGRLGVEEATERIAALLLDEAGQVRVAAVEALSHLQNERAGAELEKAASAMEEDVRRAALIGLGLTRRPGALPILLDNLRTGDAATRLVAVSSLSDFKAPEVLPALTRAANDPDESVRTAAIGFLASAHGVEATRTLVTLLADPARRELVRSALSVWADGRIEGLLSALDFADDELAPELTSALVRLRRQDATAAVFRAFESPNAAARKAAASTLAAIATPPAFSALQRHASEDLDPEVRRVCALLLAQ